MGDSVAHGGATIDVTVQLGVPFAGLHNQGRAGLAGNFHIQPFNLETLDAFTRRVTLWRGNFYPESPTG